MSGPRPTPAFDRVMRRSIESVAFGTVESRCISCFLATAGDGYPVVTGDDGRQTTAARVVWEHSNGRIPDGLVVCHKCNNPACVNIRHMFLGTHGDRSALKVSLGRARGNSKLAAWQVKEIIARASRGEKNTDLAREYGVTARAVSNIKHGRSWKRICRKASGQQK